MCGTLGTRLYIAWLMTEFVADQPTPMAVACFSSLHTLYFFNQTPQLLFFFLLLLIFLYGYYLGWCLLFKGGIYSRKYNICHQCHLKLLAVCTPHNDDVYLLQDPPQLTGWRNAILNLKMFVSTINNYYYYIMLTTINW